MGLRQDRLGDQVRDILAMQFSGENLRDPRVQGVTVTAVKLTADLQLAKVYFRVFNEENVKEVEAGLKSCSGYLRNLLSKALDVRRSPELRFIYDESVDEGAKIEKMLEQIRND